MKTKFFFTVLAFALIFTKVFGQNLAQTNKYKPEHKFLVCTSYLTFTNFGPEKTNTHHYEFHFMYKPTAKDRVGIKVATWKLFAPMGIQLWDPLFRDESEFFPGRLKETGVGVTYQRLLWKGLFAQVEVLPLWKTYLDTDKNKIDDGFKLYTSYHVGYHLSFFRDRFYIEPQIHCNYWPIDSKAPQSFEAKESKWSNYFLLEPNLYLGVKF
jgi:hypothetical protein